jgi:AcrR family transcriptional regulator
MLKGSIYYHVCSKQDLLREIVDEVHQIALDELRGIIDSYRSPFDAARAGVRAHIAIVRQNLPSVAVTIRDFRSLAPRDRMRFTALQRTYRLVLRDLFERSSAEGSRCGCVSAETAAGMVVGLTHLLTSNTVSYASFDADLPVAFTRFLLHGPRACQATDLEDSRGRAVTGWAGGRTPVPALAGKARPEFRSSRAHGGGLKGVCAGQRGAVLPQVRKCRHTTS